MENITKKEIWLGVAIVLVILAIAVYFEPFIKDSMMKEIRLYQNALRVDNDSSYDVLESNRITFYFNIGTGD